MKKISTLFILLFAVCAVHAQFAILGGDTQHISGSTDPTAEIVTQGYCVNNGTTSKTIVWQIVSDSLQAGWSYTGYCDKHTCYSFSIGLEKSFTLVPAEHGILQLHILPLCNTGTGFVKIRFWDNADSANTSRIVTYLITINSSSACSSGINETEIAQIAFSPNPVKNQLKIAIPQSLQNGKIELYNLLGSRVYEQSINGSRELDLSNIEAGMYIARIIDSGKLLTTKRLTKVN